MMNRWRGPYLDVPMQQAGAGDPFMVRGLDASEFEAVNAVVDGEAQEPGFPGCTQCSWARGRLRYHGASGITYFLATPYRSGP